MNSQIVIAGIGGQGVLFAAGILIEASRLKGLPVLGSETHGMSQRGGSVTSHLKIGDFSNPLVSEGDADVLLGFDPTETLRSLMFLRRANGASGASCIVGVPGPGVFPDPRVEGLLSDMGIAVHTAMADAEALKMGNIRAVNLMLLGFATGLGAFPFTSAEMEEAVSQASPPGQRTFNKEVFLRGADLPDLSRPS